MRPILLITVPLLAAAIAVVRAGDPAGFQPETIIALERAALDLWGKGDPLGCLEFSAPSVTYFDPELERRLDGKEALRRLYTPLIGKIDIPRYEMINPKVQRHGGAAVLTYNLVSYGKQPDGKEKVTSRWNATEVYAQVDGKWKVVHTHWSYTKPELKRPSSE